MLKRNAAIFNALNNIKKREFKALELFPSLRELACITMNCKALTLSKILDLKCQGAIFYIHSCSLKSNKESYFKEGM
jgi:hypothetical protein